MIEASKVRGTGPFGHRDGESLVATTAHGSGLDANDKILKATGVILLGRRKLSEIQNMYTTSVNAIAVEGLFDSRGRNSDQGTASLKKGSFTTNARMRWR